MRLALIAWHRANFEEERKKQTMVLGPQIAIATFAQFLFVVGRLLFIIHAGRSE
jgi:hypothetical protein